MLQGTLLTGDFTFAAHGLAATAYRAAGVEHPGGALLVLPLLQLPLLRLRAGMDWTLPEGRSPAQHHLFPPAPPGADLAGGSGPQAPILAGVAYKADALDLTLDIQLTDGAGGGGAPAVAFLGDHQVQFMKRWVAALRGTPAAVRAVVRRGTFFVRKPPPAPGAPPKKGIPRLLRKVRVCGRVGVGLGVALYSGGEAENGFGTMLPKGPCLREAESWPDLYVLLCRRSPIHAELRAVPSPSPPPPPPACPPALPVLRSSSSRWRRRRCS